MLSPAVIEACTFPAPRTIIAKEAPKAAPWEIPRVKGEARGLRRTVCIIAPVRPSPAPATIAEPILINLNLRIRFEFSPLEKRISRGLKTPLPIRKEAKLTKSSKEKRKRPKNILL